MSVIDAPTKAPVTEIGDPDTEPGKLTHIVVVPKGQNAEAYVLEARINGTPIRALCGYVWVPNQDPMKLPKCSKCVDIFDKARGPERHGY